MTLAELCIRRPVMTVLLSLTAVIAGILAYSSVPIAALPRFDTPTITVSAMLPGASPDTMASAVVRHPWSESFQRSLVYRLSARPALRAIP
jgi:HAE1 family hydrophobic/amphiphilic exporter-1